PFSWLKRRANNCIRHFPTCQTMSLIGYLPFYSNKRSAFDWDEDRTNKSGKYRTLKENHENNNAEHATMNRGNESRDSPALDHEQGSPDDQHHE
ncbi:hypothetical protein PMAYCL1PPCAC_27760, partial [Pristionchus mayeri]